MLTQQWHNACYSRRQEQIAMTQPSKRTSHTDAAQVFEHLIAHCLDLLQVQAVAVMVADASRGGLSAVIASSAAADELVTHEVLHDNGPAGDCYRTGANMPFLDLHAAADMWPDFARMAIAAGFHECSCLPMRQGDHTIGVLQLFGPLDTIGVRVAGALSDVASLAALTQTQQSEIAMHATPIAGNVTGEPP